MVCVSSIYQSHVHMSSAGHEFQPHHPVQLILQTPATTRLRCSSACNQRSSCRAFDYNPAASRCRLFEGDLTTGSIIPSASPTSSVGIVTVSPALFSQTHNKSCPACQNSRYETCSPITQRCQCDPHTFWDGSMCSLQRFENDSCSQVDGCRADLNLVCMKSFGGSFVNCLPGAYEHKSELMDPCIFRVSRRATEIRNDESSTRAPYCVAVEQSQFLGRWWM